MPKENIAPRSRSRRMAYDASFKLKVLSKAVEYGSNRKAASFFGVNEKQVRDWMKKKDQLAVAARSAKRLGGGGRPVTDSAMDSQLIDWIDGQRKNGNAVTGKQLQRQAIRMANDRGSAAFKASDGWLRSFKRRHSLSTRKKTSLGQKLPPDYEEKIILFHRFVIQLRDKHQYELSDIYNMDETPLRFDMPGERTLERSGAKSVHIKTTGSEKKGFTAVLTVAADGTKLAPTIIFKGKRDQSHLSIQEKLRVRVQEKGYIDEKGCIDYIRRTFPRLNEDRRRLLVWDSCRVHLTERVKDELRDRNIDVAVIPGGLTPLLQPLDVGCNKPVKDSLKDLWDEWMKNGEAEYTPSGKRRCPSREMVLQWVLSAWEDLSPSTVIRSFLKCGISNRPDGTEDDLVYDDLSTDDESEIDEDLADRIADIFDSDIE